MNTFDAEIQNRETKREGKLTRKIEARTAKVPSFTYMGLAIGSMVASAGFMLAGKKHLATFIGQWVPSLLIIGLYNKIVKVEEELLPPMEEAEGT